MKFYFQINMNVVFMAVLTLGFGLKISSYVTCMYVHTDHVGYLIKKIVAWSTAAKIQHHPVLTEPKGSTAFLLLAAARMQTAREY